MNAMRPRLFEFEDLTWFPDAIRHGGTDFLGFFLSLGSFYEPVVPLLAGLMKESGARSIVDHCSGSGGNIEEIHAGLEKALGEKIHVKLTDRFPANFKDRISITYQQKPLNVMNDSSPEPGVRTMFTAIHHFDEEAVVKVLQKMTATGDPVAIFDGADRNIATLLAIPLLQPFLFTVFTPFIKPFRWSRLGYTYLLPLIPIMTIWDGMVSVYRLYNHSELARLAMRARPEYDWKSGVVRNRFGFGITFLTGVARR
jgi:hypothetical protein